MEKKGHNFFELTKDELRKRELKEQLKEQYKKDKQKLTLEERITRLEEILL